MQGTTEAADDLASLLRPELADLTAYVPLDPPGIEVKLYANEAPPNVSPAIRVTVGTDAERERLLASLRRIR